MDLFDPRDIPGTIYDHPTTIRLTGGQVAVANQICGMMIGSLKTIFDDILNSVEKEDMNSLRMSAHKLQGGLSYLGAPQLLYLTQHLESAARTDNIVLARDIFPLFCDAVSSLQKSLAPYH
jgi:HPt (histidine-containing phosphotransfer) domain-containing protein